mgnify:CR=1 FL=1
MVPDGPARIREDGTSQDRERDEAPVNQESEAWRNESDQEMGVGVARE